MLFPEEDALPLKAWIVKRIENTSDADADVLAEYVIALLKHDGTQDDVRKLCEQEIPDFLTEDPKSFLDDVFQALRYKSYLPGAPLPPKLPFSGPSEPSQPADSSSPIHLGLRKRGFDDGGDVSDRDQSNGGQRVQKLPRRGGRRGLDDGRGSAHTGMSMPQLQQGLPQFDFNNPMEAFIQMQQAMGIPFPLMQGFSTSFGGKNQRGGQSRRRGRCRDFDTKGFCSRGGTCMYDHGDESIYVPPSGLTGDEYDPSDAGMHLLAPSAMGGQFTFSPDVSRGRGGKRGRGNNITRGGRKGGARAPFSADGPVHDRSKSTIVVENIPEENFDENQVREFFAQFGNIVDVSMQPYKHLAIVKYDKWAAANDAYRSPRVIFDNRFVKVFWYRDDKATQPQSQPLNGFNESPAFGQPAGSETPGPEVEVDMEGFQRKQEEAQKQHQEREAKRSNLERQRQELEKQQQDLLEKHQKETERLRAKLFERDGGGGGQLSGSAGTEALRVQLAALEHEAKILGIDPNGAEDGAMASHRGGYRGRRGFRGRGGFAPRGRGSFRGQGARHAAYAQFSIDNRPRKIAIKGVDFTQAHKDELLRHFLLNQGEFSSVETGASVTHVSFPDRKTAEKIYYSLHGKELPGIEGKLELSWVSAPLPPVAAKGLREDVAMTAADDGMGLAEGQGKEKLAPPPHEEARHVDMDYEVGDDDAWGDGIQ